MKRLVLLGDGPAHRQVVRDLARERLAGAQALWVTPSALSFSAAMLPGFVAGRYRAVDCAVGLPPLAAAADVRWVESAVLAVDAAQRRVALADGRVAEYDLLSIDDDGGVMDRQAIPGAREQGLFLQPAESFVRLFDDLLDLAARRVLDVVVVGGGRAGVELALALQHRLALDEERARIVLVTGGEAPLAGHAEAVMRHAARRLTEQRITVIREPCLRIDPHAVHLGNGARLACDAPLIATALRPAPWLPASGLALDAEGQPAVGPTLQSVSNAEVFAVGGRQDVGAGLALNLRRHVGGGALQPVQPPRRTLEMIGCGGHRAIAAWGGITVEGRWAAWWKERRERREQRRWVIDRAAGAR